MRKFCFIFHVQVRTLVAKKFRNRFFLVKTRFAEEKIQNIGEYVILRC